MSALKTQPLSLMGERREGGREIRSEDIHRSPSPQKTIFFLNSTSTVFTLEAYIVQRAVLATEWEYLGEYSLT